MPASVPAPDGTRPSRGLHASHAAIGFPLAAAAVIAIAINLRPGASAPGPLMDRIQAAFGASEASAGLLTALPCFAFGILGAVAVPFAKRFGLTGAIVIGALLMTAGLLLRPFVGSMGLFLLLSVFALAGPALGNVLVPAWVKRHGGTRIVPLMTLYTVVLALGGSLGSLLAVPLAPAGPDGWRISLMYWGLLALVPFLLWTVVLTRTGHDFPPAGPGGHLKVSLLRSPTAVSLALLFGMQSTNAYVQFGWMPRMFVDAGMHPGSAGGLVALLASLGIVGGLVMPTIVARSRHLRWVILGLAVLTAAGWMGMLLAPIGGAVLWALMLGVGGFLFPAAIAMIPARSRSALVTARLSGMAQPFGYIIAGFGPLLAGAVRGATGSWTEVFIGLALLALAMGAIGYRAASGRAVDYELRAVAAKRAGRRG